MMTPPATSSLASWLALGLCPLVLVGCQAFGGGRTERNALESQLRRRESRITSLELDLATAKSELQASQREIIALRKSVATQGDQVAKTPLLSEQAQSTFRIESVEISSLLSGGLDRDDTPGDEILSVLLTPLDSTGGVLRAEGAIEMNAYDLSRPSGQQLIGSWVFDEESTRPLWHSGVIGKGFHLNVNWKTPPARSAILVHCRFTTTDDRAFDTNSTVSVTPELSIVK